MYMFYSNIVINFSLSMLTTEVLASVKMAIVEADRTAWSDTMVVFGEDLCMNKNVDIEFNTLDAVLKNLHQVHL
jgi:hypothetical protein